MPNTPDNSCDHNHMRKGVADQLGHGLGVNLDVYTISDLTQRLESVSLLEQSLASTAIN